MLVTHSSRVNCSPVAVVAVVVVVVGGGVVVPGWPMVAVAARKSCLMLICTFSHLNVCAIVLAHRATLVAEQRETTRRAEPHKPTAQA